MTTQESVSKEVLARVVSKDVGEQVLRGNI
jgi:hypothetical protein